MLPWKIRKCQILPVNQNVSSVYFSLAKFQLLSCNRSLAMIWQMTYTDKLPKLLRWIKEWVLVTCGVLWPGLVFSSIFLYFNLRRLCLRPEPPWTLNTPFFKITWPATPIIMQNLDFADYTSLLNVTTIVFPSIISHLQSNKLH